MKAPDVRDRMAAAGVEVGYRRLDEFAPYLKQQKARFAEIIRKGDIRIE